MAEMDKDELWARYAEHLLMQDDERPQMQARDFEAHRAALHALVTEQRAEARREAARECLECIVRDGQDDDQADDTYGAARWTARQNIARDIRSRFHLSTPELPEIPELKPLRVQLDSLHLDAREEAGDALSQGTVDAMRALVLGLKKAGIAPEEEAADGK